MMCILMYSNASDSTSGINITISQYTIVGHYQDDGQTPVHALMGVVGCPQLIVLLRGSCGGDLPLADCANVRVLTDTWSHL